MYDNPWPNQDARTNITRSVLVDFSNTFMHVTSSVLARNPKEKPIQMQRFDEVAGLKESDGLTKPFRILIVDQSLIVNETVKKAFAPITGISVLTTVASRARKLIRTTRPQIVIVDSPTRHPAIIKLIQKIRRYDSSVKFIIFTRDPAVTPKLLCFEAGANYYLDDTQLLELIEICRLEYLNLVSN